jgi:hypothetical protein
VTFARSAVKPFQALPLVTDGVLERFGFGDEELALAWDLWFDLSQTTNDNDPLYTHGVFQNVRDERPQSTRRPHQTVSRVDDPRS